MRIAAAALLLLLLLVAVEAWAFVLPGGDDPGPADLVVVLGGNHKELRVARALELVRQYAGSTLLVSAPEDRFCPATAPGAERLICFHPQPKTTRGEARYIGAYARAHHADSVEVVVTADQLRRARLRFKRCFHGTLRMIKAHAPLSSVVGLVPYQNAASAKAIVLERSC
jgi:uncharacterized SAM-binding protein YcdF (DUF218 family)